MMLASAGHPAGAIAGKIAVAETGIGIFVHGFISLERGVVAKSVIGGPHGATAWHSVGRTVL